MDEEQQRVAKEIISCTKDFKYFLRNYVYTLDSQAGRGVQKFPDWKYVERLADAVIKYRQVVLLKSRQLIITWFLAAWGIHQTMFFRGALIPIVSKGGRESREIGNRAKFIWRNLPEWLRLEMKPNEQYGELNFPSMDSKIICLPSTPDIGRTFSAGGIILDEAAFLPYGSEIMGALAPIIDTKGWFIGVSTPNGKDSLFHPLWHEENPEIHKLTLHWSDRPDRDENWKKVARRAPGMTPQKWAREQEHSFATPAGKPVYQNFSAKQMIPCFEGWNKVLTVIRGWDRGFHCPATVWTFLNGADQWAVAKAHMGDDITRDAYIKFIVEKSHIWFPEADFIDWVPSDCALTESDGQSWVKVMKKHGIYPKIGKAGRDEVSRRVDAVRQKINMRQDGKYGLIVDPSCDLLIEGLAGGYHYPEVIDKPQDERPVKDGYYDHLQNALEVIADNHFSTWKTSSELKTIRAGRKKQKVTTIWQ